MDENLQVNVAKWDGLHEQSRFRPVYPSEPVVRFVGRHFGGLDQPVEGADLLDIGCGAGRHVQMMARAGHRVSAVDISAEGVTVTRDRLSAGGLTAEVKQGSMTDLPFEDASFDGAVAYGVFLYGDGAVFRTAVDEAHRVLRPGGHLLVVTRSDRDGRVALGDQVEPGTVRLTSNDTNEQGLLMHFLDDKRLGEHFSSFSDIAVERIDFTVGGGTFLNADLVIDATK